MRKTVIKTALYTVLSLICVLFLGVFSTFAFAPKVSAKVCFDLGLKGLSTTCYERVYKKSGELEDLITVIDSAVYAEKKDSIEKYGVLLFDTYGKTVEFAEFCKSEDEGMEEGSFKTYDYYANTVFMALYESGKKTDCAEFAISYYNQNGYYDKCVLKTAVRFAEEDEELGHLLISFYKANKIIESNFVKEMKELGYKF